jgi:hypothetical protein
MALAATLIPVGAQLLGGALQAAFSGKREKEAALEQQAANAPKYQGSSALNDYYQKSLQQANTAAQQSAMYKQNMNLIRRNLAQGLAAGAGSGQLGQGGVAKLVAGANDASSNALVGAEQQRERRFAQLGNVTQQKAGEDFRKFQINQQAPWETKYNLLAAKAAKAAEQQAAGLSNIYGGLTQGAKLASTYDPKTKTFGGTTSYINPATGLPY